MSGVRDGVGIKVIVDRERSGKGRGVLTLGTWIYRWVMDWDIGEGTGLRETENEGKEIIWESTPSPGGLLIS